MKKPVLSLCFPTYNRGWCMKEQLERLMTCPREILDKIEILISDNCSTDDTQQIVENAIAKGFICKYMRNEINLGPDSNFVSCFRNAQGRYVWLLGDDDTIIIDSLIQIVNLLDVPEEYGLLHITPRNDTQNDIVYISDKNQILKHISYQITFISANIVNSKYRSFVAIEELIGSWLPYVPLYLVALTHEPLNIIFGKKSFEVAKALETNGGYNFFEVFVQSYLIFLAKYINDGALYAWLKKDVWPFVFGYTKQLLVKKNVGNFHIQGGWKILFKYYANEWYFWWTLIRYPFIKIPAYAMRYLKKQFYK